MTDDERKSLAEQLMSNPLLHIIFDELEASATKKCIKTDDDAERKQHALEARLVQKFRQKCNSAMNNAGGTTGDIA